MKLNDALKLVAAARACPAGQRVALVCGIEPLHLATFMQAEFAARTPGTRLELEAGLFGDLAGNLSRAAQRGEGAVAVVIEWADLDPRLGLRSAGAWSGGANEASVLRAVGERLARMASWIEALAARGRVAICPPTLPFSLAAMTPSEQHSGFELALQHALDGFLLRVSQSPRCLLVHPTWLERSSPPHERHDPRMELAAGFPYRVAHASAVAAALIALLFPRPAKKALITDLDDTLWAGLVGEIGADQVQFTQASGAQLHGVYQLLLRQLADIGVLLGVASKNDPEVVHAALARPDLWLDGSQFFPVHAGWGAKSHAVSAILRSWNLAAEDVVFVDDSAMELAEVQRLHPGLECLLFPPNDPAQALRLFERLRELFGRAEISSDDHTRAASLRALAAFEADKAVDEDPDAFIRKLDGELRMRQGADIDAPRALQLLNKTNQFNLNARRLTDAEFTRLLEDERGFVLEVAYSDRYGPLGVVGIAAGKLEAERLLVEHWVLSCRAFSRRIEHHMLHALIGLAQGRAVRLAYQPSPRNAPLRRFLEELGVELGAPAPLWLAPTLTRTLEQRLVHQLAGDPGG